MLVFDQDLDCRLSTSSLNLPISTCESILDSYTLTSLYFTIIYLLFIISLSIIYYIPLQHLLYSTKQLLYIRFIPQNYYIKLAKYFTNTSKSSLTYKSYENSHTSIINITLTPAIHLHVTALHLPYTYMVLPYTCTT